MKLYTAEEAAEVLRLSKWTVWKYGREGKLRTVKFGRTVRYDLEGGKDDKGNSWMDDGSSPVVRLRLLHGGSCADSLMKGE